MNQYRYKCPTKGCEIDTILVSVHEDVIEYFGFCCPFCQDHMVRDDTHQSERDKVMELLRLKYVEFLNHPCPELADKYDHCCDVDWCGLCTLDEVLAELR